MCPRGCMAQQLQRCLAGTTAKKHVLADWNSHEGSEIAPDMCEETVKPPTVPEVHYKVVTRRQERLWQEVVSVGDDWCWPMKRAPRTSL
mmetsp:Transcript_55844/g.154639  ORF Transcript_55844/g.154639 Transcript_55844/m.154639 type:complete len:89 (-) Transcript_55844:320-586(-)